MRKKLSPEITELTVLAPVMIMKTIRSLFLKMTLSGTA